MNSTELIISDEANQGLGPNASEFGEHGFESISLPASTHDLSVAEGAATQPLGVFGEGGFDSPSTHTETHPQLHNVERTEPGVISNDMPQGRHAAPYSATSETYRGDRQLALLIEPEGIAHPGDRQASYVPRHAAQPRLESLAAPQPVERSRGIGRPLVQRVVSVFSPTKYLEGRSFSRRPRWKY